MTIQELAARFDHAVLRPETPGFAVEEAARRCLEAGVRGLCVLPRHLDLARGALGTGGTLLVAVANFPSGGSPDDVVAGEIRRAVAAGADEIDLVLRGDLIAGGRWKELAQLVGRLAAKGRGRTFKWIVEASGLEESALAAVIETVFSVVPDHYLKTGTGVYGRPVSVDRIGWLRRTLPATAGLKVAGGIRDLAAGRAAVSAGADVLGASATLEILADAAESR